MLEKLEAKFKTIKPGPPRDKATILASFARARTDLPLAADFFRDSNINLSPGAGYAGPLDFAIKYQRNQHEAPNNKLLTNCQFLTQKALYEGGNVKLSAYREDADDIKPKENTLHALFEQTTTIPNRDLPILNIYLDHASDKEDLKKAVMEASSDDLKLYNILLNLPAESVTNPQEIILTIEKIESITGVPLKDGAKNGKFWARHPALKEYVKRKDLQNLF
jgi:hypothetical protein